MSTSVLDTGLESQRVISAEISKIHADAPAGETQPRLGFPPYRSAIPAVGGAMDLAIGARQTFVMMTLLTRDGRRKLVPECTYPLAGVGCVSRVYTDLAVFLLVPGQVVVRDLFGVDLGELAALVGIPLVLGPEAVS